MLKYKIYTYMQSRSNGLLLFFNVSSNLKLYRASLNRAKKYNHWLYTSLYRVTTPCERRNLVKSFNINNDTVSIAMLLGVVQVLLIHFSLNQDVYNV